MSFSCLACTSVFEPSFTVDNTINVHWMYRNTEKGLFLHTDNNSVLKPEPFVQLMSVSLITASSSTLLIFVCTPWLNFSHFFDFLLSFSIGNIRNVYFFIFFVSLLLVDPPNSYFPSSLLKISTPSISFFIFFLKFLLLVLLSCTFFSAPIHSIPLPLIPLPWSPCSKFTQASLSSYTSHVD